MVGGWWKIQAHSSTPKTKARAGQNKYKYTTNTSAGFTSISDSLRSFNSQHDIEMVEKNKTKTIAKARNTQKTSETKTSNDHDPKPRANTNGKTMVKTKSKTKANAGIKPSSPNTTT
jgi:hypothetical protein